MTSEQFLMEHARLVREHAESGSNLGCVESATCRGCIDCVFCVDCLRCYRSRYSNGCADSSQLTHCQRCRLSNGLAYCQECASCGDSNYLSYCNYCFECDYCFGCVGLVKTDFHILNVKYSRGDYFRLVSMLRDELKLPAPGA